MGEVKNVMGPWRRASQELRKLNGLRVSFRIGRNEYGVFKRCCLGPLKWQVYRRCVNAKGIDTTNWSIVLGFLTKRQAVEFVNLRAADYRARRPRDE